MSIRKIISLTKSWVDLMPFGLATIIVRPLYRGARTTLRFAILALYSPLAAIFWLNKISVPGFFVERIGHLMVEPDAFIKESLLRSGNLPRALFLADRKKSANRASVAYWSKYFVVVQNPILVALLRPLQLHPWTRFDVRKVAFAIDECAEVYRIQREWADRPPLLKLTTVHEEAGQRNLQKMGMTEGSWFVCIHVRTGGYSHDDEKVHTFRSANGVADFSLAMDYIVSQGGYCVRMGDSSMPPLIEKPKIIDYALSPYKSEWMDLYLSATCKFFLGSNSGAYHMATTFGRPSALVGMAPLSIMGTGVNDISIPMLYKKHERVLNFNEVFDSPLANYRTMNQYANAGICLVPNTPYEIYQLAVEQFERVMGDYSNSYEDDRRQKQFKNLFKSHHYSFGAASRIGDQFLKTNRHLLIS